MFKLNQRVWSHFFGWGVITKIHNGVISVLHKERHENKIYCFYTNGKYYRYDLYPSLFHDEVKEWPNPDPPKPDFTGKELFVSLDNEKWYIRTFIRWNENNKVVCKHRDSYEVPWDYYKEMKDG